MQNDKRALKLYLIIVLVASIVIETIWIAYGEKAAQAGISSLLMFVPFIAALVVGRKYYKKQRSLGFLRFKPVFVIVAILLPFIYFGLSYGTYWLSSKGSYVGNLNALIEYAATYSQNVSGKTAIIISLIITLPVTLITALGEEAGWRGLMYPVMQRLWSWKKAIMISGGVWAVWHLPLVISGVYLPGTAMVYTIPALILEVFALTVIITWLRVKSNSVWPAIVFHAAHNYFDQIIFQSLTSNANSTYFVGEKGIISIAITAIIAVLILVFDRAVFSKTPTCPTSNQI